MKYCSHCGAQVHDDAVICVTCGCALQPIRIQNNSEDGLLIAAKIFMIILCVFPPLMGASCGLYLGAFAIWYGGLGLFIGCCVHLAWCIPMTVYLCKRINNNEPINTAFKICTLIFASKIAGILLLCHKDD